jgi:hypothetical protein
MGATKRQLETINEGNLAIARLRAADKVRETGVCHVIYVARNFDGIELYGVKNAYDYIDGDNYVDTIIPGETVATNA